jgi:putative transposase
MSKDNVIAIKKPDTFVDDPISEILRQGARSLITQALEIEIEIFVNQYKDLRDQMGLQRIVRNGYLPERQIQTGIGPVSVKAPRIRDRHQNASKRIQYSSTILLPPYQANGTFIFGPMGFTAMCAWTINIAFW